MQFIHYISLLIVCTKSLVFNCNLIKAALINEFSILVVSDLALSTSFKFFPSIFFNHCCISIHILSIQSNFFQLFCKSFVFFFLILLLFTYFLICFLKIFLPNLSFFLLKLLSCSFFILSSFIIIFFSFLSSFFNS